VAIHAQQHPKTIGKFDVLLPIARGGMATVYLARSRASDGFETMVALKLSHAHLSDSPEFANTLRDEASLASRIRHENVVSILDVGEDPQGLFLVMEYVEGDSLSGLMSVCNKRGLTLPFGVAVRIVLDALAGLEAAHSLKAKDGSPLNVVHRDFSPHNVLVSVDGTAQLISGSPKPRGN
jgi:eukaryotic-like serine/threonine-protein kinase